MKKFNDKFCTILLLTLLCHKKSLHFKIMNVIKFNISKRFAFCTKKRYLMHFNYFYVLNYYARSRFKRLLCAILYCDNI